MWITVWCWGIILFGAVMATAGIPALDGIARLAFNIIGGAQTGAVTLGWDFTILFLLPAIHAAGAPAWRGLTAAALIWLVIDSAFSLSTGFELSAVSNTLLMTGLLVPLLASGALKSAH